MYTEEELEAVEAIEKFLQWCYNPICLACNDTGTIVRGCGGGLHTYGAYMVPCSVCSMRKLIKLAPKVLAEKENEDLKEWAKRLGKDIADYDCDRKIENIKKGNKTL